MLNKNDLTKQVLDEFRDKYTFEGWLIEGGSSGGKKVAGYIKEVIDLTISAVEEALPVLEIARKHMTFGGTHASLEESEIKGETLYQIDYRGFEKEIQARLDTFKEER